MADFFNRISQKRSFAYPLNDQSLSASQAPVALHSPLAALLISGKASQSGAARMIRFKLTSGIARRNAVPVVPLG
jgi:hypothetical protein